jgi:hypothetical protein
MKLILALLVIAGFLSGCTVASMQPAALAYEGAAEDTIETGQTFSVQQDRSAADTPEAAYIPTPGLAETSTPLATAILPTPSPTRYAFGPYTFPKEINPLTGLPVEDPVLLERRPIVIKVTNFPRSVRPQWGLSQADNVFEYFIGDSMSRFIGVFYGKDAQRVGPIRSARLFDEDVMRMYNGIFVFGWADDPILEVLFAPDIKNHLVVERSNNCPPLCRLGSDDTYNNLFADTSQIGPYLDYRRTSNDRQDLNGLQFDILPPPSANPASKFFLQYSIVSYHYWEYDPVLGRYLRFQETEDAKDGSPGDYAPLVDSLNGSQLSADNVVVLFVPHEYFLRSSSTEIYDQHILGEGIGYAFRDGSVYPLQWELTAQNRRISLRLPNGLRYSLKPGNTWFEIIGESSTLEPLSEGVYRFDFGIP